jgi:acyl-CoA hydrolase
VLQVGKSSITMHVDVEAERAGEPVQLTHADVTYVAVELGEGQRRTVPIRGGQQHAKENVTTKDTKDTN